MIEQRESLVLAFIMPRDDSELRSCLASCTQTTLIGFKEQMLSSVLQVTTKENIEIDAFRIQYHMNLHTSVYAEQSYCIVVA